MCMSSFWRRFTICTSITFAFVGTVACSPARIHAQDLGVAQHIQISSSDIKDGQIISHRNQTYQKSSEAYDKSVFGIVSTKPAIEFTQTGVQGGTPIITSGTVPVLVNLENGPIKKGDQITTSSTPGEGMKATKTGFIIGIADGEFTGTDTEKTGLVLVSLSVKFAYAEDSPNSEKISNRLLDVMKLSTIATLERPLDVFKYVVAAFILLGTIAFSTFNFAKVARNATTSLGRNPLAFKQIFLSALVNIGLSILMIGSGFGGAFLLISR